MTEIASSSDKLNLKLNNVCFVQNKTDIKAKNKSKKTLGFFIKNDFDKVFNDVDAILTPSTPSAAFKMGDKKDDMRFFKYNGLKNHWKFRYGRK